MSTVTTVVDEKTGEEKERLINKGRWKGFGPTSVTFAEKGVGESLDAFLLRISNVVHDFVKVPTKPPSNVEEVRNQYDQSLVQRLEEVHLSLWCVRHGANRVTTTPSTSVLGRYGLAPRCSTNSPQPKPGKSKSTS